MATAADALYGYAGTDTLNGNGGNDILGPGSYYQQFDYVNGGAGFDVVSYLDGASVTVDLADDSFGGDGSAGFLYDVLTSIEGVFGSNVGKDAIYGSDGYNELFGFDGDDLIEGRGGADKIDGGAGVDTASYASSAARRVGRSRYRTKGRTAMPRATDCIASRTSPAPASAII